MTLFGSTLTDPDIDNILETLKIELQENLNNEDTIDFRFGVKYLTQEELGELGEFEGF